jgi:hypothetical protein
MKQKLAQLGSMLFWAAVASPFAYLGWIAFVWVKK